jgi:hypothetical protein
MQEKENILKNKTWIGYKTTDLSWTIGLTTAIIIAPAILAHTPANQIVTGTIVNALLFLAAYRLPLFNTFLIAILPSSVALLSGLLPAPMVLLIPYIIISNTILVSVFSFMKKTPRLGVFTASLLKFGFLYSITLVLAQQLNSPLIAMFQWPQLITALLGGTVCLALLKIFQTKK